ncbi:MAG: DNA mismatch endonuclease Vsr [Planctomycetes bacterium]|nr:DNA mismatch endonuclease Vsr [Planctomycetota bacterium]
MPIPPIRPSPSSIPALRRMKATHRRDTAPEAAIRRLLHRSGLRYRVDCRVLEASRRRADIVFARARVAVFVDGCFWHCCPKHASWPKANALWWRRKLLGNVRRDRDTDQALRAAGWLVIRVWEHQPPHEAAHRIRAAVRRRSAP